MEPTAEGTRINFEPELLVNVAALQAATLEVGVLCARCHQVRATRGEPFTSLVPMAPLVVFRSFGAFWIFSQSQDY